MVHIYFTSWKHSEQKETPGILLFGPPGTGKTMLAKAIASNLNMTFIKAGPSTIKSKWMGESERNVKELFELAYLMRPSVLFFGNFNSPLFYSTIFGTLLLQFQMKLRDYLEKGMRTVLLREIGIFLMNY